MISTIRVLQESSRFRLIERDGIRFVQRWQLGTHVREPRCLIITQTDEAAVYQFQEWLKRQQGPAFFAMPEKPKSEIPESEDDFQQWAIDLAHAHNWRVLHIRPARTADGGWVTAIAADGKGWPDLVLVRDRVLFRECKSNTGKLSDEQQDWGDWLTTAGADWGVWRPADRSEIEETLR